MLKLLNTYPDHYHRYDNPNKQTYICEFECENGSPMSVSITTYSGPPDIEQIEIFVLSLADYCEDFDSYLHNLEVICDADTTDDDVLGCIEHEYLLAQEFEDLVGKKLLDELRVKYDW